MADLLFNQLSKGIPAHLLYSCTNYNTARVILWLLKKYLTGLSIWNGPKPDDDIKAYYDNTLNMINVGLITDGVNEDYLYAVISNLMLIAANIEKAASKKDNNAVSFTTKKWDEAYFPRLIDSRWKATSHHEKSPQGVFEGFATFASKIIAPQKQENSQQADPEMLEIQYLHQVFKIVKEKLEEDYHGWE